MKTQEVFNKVANKYDLMNDVMSFGAHRYWKELLIDWLSPKNEMNIVDVAGGTGDIARRILKRLDDSSMITVCDPNEEMINEGKKIKKYKDKIKWIVAPAEKLPFVDNSFDAYIVSFGVRNFSNIDKALSEAYRILKPGGRFLCLEFSKIQNKNINQLYQYYSKTIPVFGKIIVGDEKPYEYLTRTIKEFHGQNEFKSILEKINFEKVEYRNIFNGVVAIHSAYK